MGLFDFFKKKKKTPEEMGAKEIGIITHYFPHVDAGVVKLNKKCSIKVGDMILIKGHTTDFKQRVESIQLDHKDIEEGKPGQDIAIQVKKRVRIHDTVYKIEE